MSTIDHIIGKLKKEILHPIEHLLRNPGEAALVFDRAIGWLKIIGQMAERAGQGRTWEGFVRDALRLVNEAEQLVAELRHSHVVDGLMAVYPGLDLSWYNLAIENALATVQRKLEAL